MIRFYNTLSGALEEFKPVTEGEVKMYTCGPTVYDFAHIGNFRTFVFEDLLRRLLEYKGFKVTHVMNITDVDDKTIAGANQMAEAANFTPLPRLRKFTAQYEKAFLEDLDTLNIKAAHMMPHAADNAEIEKMQALVQALMEKGFAYEKDGSIYYRVSSFATYGQLSKKDLSQNIEGARVDVDEYEKEQGADFVLWKKAKEGEPAWNSPWGKGRPGWHLECSSMSLSCFNNETLDIHAGGEDLIFPHHENEIAQSEAVTGKKFVNYWLHAKHLLVNGEKMSKSKGNFYTLRDLIAKGYDAMAIRYVLLATHYRSQLNFTLEGIESAKESLKRLRDFWFERSFGYLKPERKGSGKIAEIIRKAKKEVEEALEDDLNTPKALAAVFNMIKQFNSVPKDEVSARDDQSASTFLTQLDGIFGAFLRIFSIKEVPSDVRGLIEKREEARKTQNYKQADSLRDEIKKRGFILEDTPNGPKAKKLL